jgi:chitodextrinase
MSNRLFEKKVLRHREAWFFSIQCWFLSLDTRIGRGHLQVIVIIANCKYFKLFFLDLDFCMNKQLGHFLAFAFLWALALMPSLTVAQAQPAPAVTQFILVDPFTELDVGPIINGTVINLKDFNRPRISIRASTTGVGIESVRFVRDNNQGQIKSTIDNNEEYYHPGNNIANTNSYVWIASPATYTLTATPYSANRAKGTAGTPLQVTFTIIDVESDTVAPVIDSVLVLNLSQTSVELDFYATDNVGITAYEITRDSVLLATTSADPFTDSTLVAGSTYQYSVVALDSLGNRSLGYVLPPITTPAASDTIAPVIDSVIVVSLNEKSVELDFYATDNVGITAYEITRDSVLLATTSEDPFTDSTLVAGTTYQYSIVALDSAGNRSLSYELLSITTPLAPDTIAPVIDSVVVAGLTETSVELDFYATDNVGITAYEITRDSVLLATTSEDPFTDSTLVAGTTYQYSIVALDSAGNRSLSYELLSITTPLAPDTIAPVIDSGSGEPGLTETSVELDFYATDNVGITAYEITRDSVLLATTSEDPFTDSTLVAGTTYQYSIVALDSAGNRSLGYVLPPITTPAASDTIAPVIDSVIVVSLNEKSVELDFYATDNVGITAYEITRDSVLLATTSEDSFTDSSLVAGSTYQYSVVALDSLGNRSLGYVLPPITTPAASDTIAPVIDSVIVVSLNEKSVELDFYATDNVGVTAYEITRDSVLLATTSADSFTDSTLVAGSTYQYSIVALDSSGNRSLGYVLPPITTPAASDTIAPVIDSVIVVSLNEKSVELDFYATDNVGVTAYEITRDSVLLATTSADSFTDSTLVAGSTYQYSIVALDSSGNRSLSYELPITTPAAPDTVAPVIDSVVVAGLTETSVELEFYATDNVGITAYEITRDSVLLATTSADPFTDSTLLPVETYQYSVVALDSSGNRSSIYVLLPITTLPPPDTAVTGLILVDSGTEIDIGAISDGAVFQFDDLSTIRFSIRAVTTSIGIESVHFKRTDSQDSVVSNLDKFEDYYHPGNNKANTNSYSWKADPGTYTVIATPYSGNSTSSTPGTPLEVSFTLVDSTIDIEAPVINSVTTGLITQSSIALDFDATDNVGVVEYEITRDGVLLIPNTSDDPFTDTGLSPDSTYYYSVVALDSSGNRSATFWLPPISTTDIDTIPPVIHSVSVINIKGNSLELDFHATDNVAVVRYDVIQIPGLATTGITDDPYKVKNLSPLTAYIFEVIAFDPAGNASASFMVQGITTQVFSETFAEGQAVFVSDTLGAELRNQPESTDSVLSTIPYEQTGTIANHTDNGITDTSGVAFWYVQFDDSASTLGWVSETDLAEVPDPWAEDLDYYFDLMQSAKQNDELFRVAFLGNSISRAEGYTGLYPGALKYPGRRYISRWHTITTEEALADSLVSDLVGFGFKTFGLMYGSTPPAGFRYVYDSIGATDEIVKLTPSNDFRNSTKPIIQPIDTNSTYVMQKIGGSPNKLQLYFAIVEGGASFAVWDSANPATPLARIYTGLVDPLDPNSAPHLGPPRLGEVTLDLAGIINDEPVMGQFSSTNIFLFGYDLYDDTQFSIITRNLSAGGSNLSRLSDDGNPIAMNQEALKMYLKDVDVIFINLMANHHGTDPLLFGQKLDHVLGIIEGINSELNQDPAFIFLGTLEGDPVKWLDYPAQWKAIENLAATRNAGLAVPKYGTINLNAGNSFPDNLNQGLMLPGGDVHPTDVGHQHMAEKLKEVIGYKAALNP